ncbi:hypothetical protein MKQ70_03260 [Chitinophaga sedimenti]|uniref:hypothetical protein n=1 Tax=Chitinophaga sedimenti TaxID=2033606 RepID=UPI0020058A29|nr:hypothetical protein [Chitinophaga sedimenti]MCK7554078.1 hypothetical protein [Chitinophaga sedimenti]
MKHIGGMIVPNNARKLPHCSKPGSRCVLVVIDFKLIINITIADPVVMIALFPNTGISLSSLLVKPT